MAVRFKSKRRCRNCPDDELPTPVARTSESIACAAEGEMLWKAAMVSCGSQLELLFRYTVLDLPGDPIPQLKRLQARLGAIIGVREERQTAIRHE